MLYIFFAFAFLSLSIFSWINGEVEWSRHYTIMVLLNLIMAEILTHKK